MGKVVTIAISVLGVFPGPDDPFFWITIQRTCFQWRGRDDERARERDLGGGGQLEGQFCIGIQAEAEELCLSEAATKSST